MEAPETDGELSPEAKFDRDLNPYDFLKIPFGRSRPIDFSLSHFYVQHLEIDEVNQFLAIEGLDENIFNSHEALIFDI